MPDYSTHRSINGAESLVVGIIILFIGVTLLHRGYGERAQWVRMVPGRIVMGLFWTLTAAILIEAAVAKLVLRSVGPGGVGKYINNWWINTALAISIIIGLWSIWRLWRNTLGVHDPIRPDERTAIAAERTATATEEIAAKTPNGRTKHVP